MGDAATVVPIAAGMTAMITFAGYLLIHLSRIQGDSRQNNKSHYEVLRESEARAQRLEERIVRLIEQLEVQSSRRLGAEDQAARLRLQVHELGGSRATE